VKARLHSHQYTFKTIGEAISSPEQLAAAIDRVATREPACHELLGENGCSLMMGIGRTLGCVQFSHQDYDPPYLLATTEEAKRSGEGDMEFLMGETPTPIRKRYCLPLDLVKEIAIHFLKTGEPSQAVEWEKV
jgi:hypothetical protein